MVSMASPMTTLVFHESLGLRLVSRGGGVVGLSLVYVLAGLILGLSRPQRNEFNLGS